MNWGTGGGRRHNGRGQSGRNNRRSEVSNDAEVKENHGGDIGNAEQFDNSVLELNGMLFLQITFSIPVILFSLFVHHSYF